MNTILYTAKNRFSYRSLCTLFFCWGFLFITFPVKGQTDSLPASRNDVENHRSRGLVVTDIKGVSIQIGGLIQSDFMADMKGMVNRYGFQPSSILVPTYNNAETNFSIRQSRLNFSARGPDNSPGTFYALLELDLSGPDGTTAPRLRHAWISYGKWGFGQYWSNFTDNETWPNLMDFGGPNAAIWRRQIQLRYTQELNRSNTLAFAIEQPGADVTLPADSAWSVRNVFPDLTGSYIFRWNKNSHIKLSGLLHPIAYRTTINNTSTIIGTAFSLSGSVRTIESDALKFQASYGTGYARYNEDLSGLGYDAFPDPSDRYKLKPLIQRYLWIFYDRWWSKKWSSTIGWGNVTVKARDYLPPTAVSHTNYGAINLLWYPNDYFKIGVELLYGNRKNKSGETGENMRIQFSVFAKL